MEHRKLLWSTVAALAMASFIWSVYKIGIFDIQPHDIEAFLRNRGPYAAVGSISLMIAHSFVPIPAEIVAIANGAIFGPLHGAFLTWLGAMLGSCLSFLISRRLKGPVFGMFVPARYAKSLEGWDITVPTLLLVRLVPLIPFNLVNYLAGLSRVRMWPFFWTTALGILPMSVLSAALGSELVEPSGLGWTAPAIGIGALILLGVIVRPLMRKRENWRWLSRSK